LALDLPEGVQSTVSQSSFEKVLTKEALAFVATCNAASITPRGAAVGPRRAPEAAGWGGEARFPSRDRGRSATATGPWRPLPRTSSTARVEITGQVDRKMIVNALNLRRRRFLPISRTPAAHLDQHGQGPVQPGKRGATARSTMSILAVGPRLQLADKTAVLFVRPRGLASAREAHDGRGVPMSGSLFDFGLYFFITRRKLLARRPAVLTLPAQIEKPSRGAAVERGVRAGPGRTRRAAESTRPDADRDHPRDLRAGRCVELRNIRPASIAAMGYIFSFIKKFPEQDGRSCPTPEVTMTRISCAPTASS